MIKYLVVLANAVIFSVLGFLFDDSVTVTVNSVDSARPGETINVELVIDKNDITSFAKIQTELAEGLNAEGLELNGGTFSYKNSLVKIFWFNLPSEKTITVSYQINIPPSYTEDIKLGGKFSYIVNNERKVVDFEEKTIKLSTEEAQIVKTEVKETPTTEVAQNETANELVIVTEEKANPTVEIKRSISKNTIEPGESIKVTLNLKTKNLNGFAKIQETIPSGFTVQEGSNFGASFSNTGNVIKLLWMKFPSQGSFSIDYTLVASANTSGDFKLDNAVFSYVDPNKTSPQKFIIASNTFQVKSTVVAQVDTPTEKSETPEQAVKKQAAPTKSFSNKSVNGLNYRVQICATHTETTTDYFVTNNNVNEEIYMEMHQGWTKFTVGNFGLYKEARDYREEVRTNYSIVGPFVTAYNDGTRITVQEALMTSNQRWYP
jgi:hypothetical protein